MARPASARTRGARLIKMRRPSAGMRPIHDRSAPPVPPFDDDDGQDGHKVPVELDEALKQGRQNQSRAISLGIIY